MHAIWNEIEGSLTSNSSASASSRLPSSLSSRLHDMTCPHKDITRSRTTLPNTRSDHARTTAMPLLDGVDRLLRTSALPISAQHATETSISLVHAICVFTFLLVLPSVVSHPPTTIQIPSTLNNPSLGTHINRTGGGLDRLLGRRCGGALGLAQRTQRTVVLIERGAAASAGGSQSGCDGDPLGYGGVAALRDRGEQSNHRSIRLDAAVPCASIDPI